ncbi:MAG: phytanoyl-CoA dioxygenase family protein [Pseudomonadota bacterium]
MLAENLDLQFKPVPEQPGARLSRAQIATFNREGYVRPFAIFDHSEIGEIRRYIDGLMVAMGDKGAYGINCYQARLSGLWDIATDPRILDPVSDLVGPNVLCWATAILSKKAGDPRKVPWHQDAAFWRLSPARTVTVWLAIDDVDEENAAMMFIPKTHAMGRIPVQETGADSVFHLETAGAERLGAPVFNALRAGEISLHADMLVHGSLPNHSARRRCGLTLRYCPPDVEIVDTAWARGVEAILCRGEDPTGRWAHHPRPANNDVTKTSSPHVVGNN